MIDFHPFPDDFLGQPPSGADRISRTPSGFNSRTTDRITVGNACRSASVGLSFALALGLFSQAVPASASATDESPIRTTAGRATEDRQISPARHDEIPNWDHIRRFMKASASRLPPEAVGEDIGNDPEPLF
jgi:hypothetical protein